LKEKYSNHPNIYILDPIYNQEKLDVLRSNAALYVHGHTAGGTNPSLVEAMYLGLPILANSVSYNKVTTENKAIYFNSLETLIHELDNIYTSKLKQIGTEMEQIAKRRYTWSHIAQKYQLLVDEALEIKTKNAVIPEISTLKNEALLNNGLAHFKTFKSF
jgi:glycosyltransferase involved in cell wall biosynthesis